jgi:hypothetical protein
MTNRAVIASAAWRSRLSCAGKQKRRDCFSGSHFYVFARNVEISVVIDGQGVKIEIASQARNDSNIVSSRVYILSSRGTKRSRLSCAGKQKSEIASQARNDKQGCHREGTICHREARSDLACRVLANRKVRLLRRLARTGKKRLLSASQPLKEASHP